VVCWCGGCFFGWVGHFECIVGEDKKKVVVEGGLIDKDRMSVVAGVD
jgi:hypothetical protein